MYQVLTPKCGSPLMQVFTTLALVGMLIVPLNAFPWVLNGVLEASVSLERIQRFFKLTNRNLQAYYALGRVLLCLLLSLCAGVFVLGFDQKQKQVLMLICSSKEGAVFSECTTHSFLSFSD